MQPQLKKPMKTLVTIVKLYHEPKAKIFFANTTKGASNSIMDDNYLLSSLAIFYSASLCLLFPSAGTRFCICQLLEKLNIFTCVVQYSHFGLRSDSDHAFLFSVWILLGGSSENVYVRLTALKYLFLCGLSDLLPFLLWCLFNWKNYAEFNTSTALMLSFSEYRVYEKKVKHL